MGTYFGGPKELLISEGVVSFHELFETFIGEQMIQQYHKLN